MKQLLIALVGLIVVVALVSIADRLRERSYSEIVADQARAEAIQRKYETDARLYEEWAPRITWVLALCVALTIAYLAGLGAAHVRSKWTLTKPDAHGLLPVARGDNDAAVAALIAYHEARIAEALRQPVPEHLHYSPRYDYRVPANATSNPALPGEVSAKIEPPTFASLLVEGLIGAGRALYLGFDCDKGEGVWGDWRDLYSAGLGGQQGSGKSWTAASIITQSLMNGARIVLCDPHAGDTESLATRIEPLASRLVLAVDNNDILNATLYAYDELERRKTAARDRTPFVLVIDEWTALLRHNDSNEIQKVVASITTEGRKYNVYALLLAQRWSAVAAGGSDVRNTLTAHYVHRTRVDEARMQTGLRGNVLPKDTLSLSPGQAYLCDARGNIRRVATPIMNQQDLVRVAQLLAEQSTAQAHQNNATTTQSKHREVAGEAGCEVAAEAAHEVASNTPLQPQQNAAKWTAEELRILAALKAGKTPGEVASELAGARGGQKYQAAARQVADVIRRALEHID